MLSPDARPMEPDRPLTDAERRIAYCLVRGMSLFAIARELHISIRTVREHIGNAGRKFPQSEVGHRITLMAWCYWSDLVERRRPDAA